MRYSSAGRSPWALAIAAGCALLWLAPLPARADADSDGTFWTGLMSTFWLDPKWGLWLDSHYNDDTFFMIRTAITRRLDSGPSVTAGYAFLLLNPDFKRHEHRPWAQIFVPHWANDRWSLSGRFRMDFRFLEQLDDGRVASGFDFVLRPRLQTSLRRSFAPIRAGTPFVSLAHEVLFNAHSDDDRDELDQNRVSLLFGLETRYVTVRTGYMHRWLPNSGSDGLHEHAAILWFTTSLDLFERSRPRVKRKVEYDDFPEYGGP